jgi:glycosyltransferase involved in cell wall biosynthesis
MADPELSIVVPVFDEESSIGAFLERLQPVLEKHARSHEIVFVNDGSRDGTLGVLMAHQRRDPRVKVVDLSRNFGKEAALSAGLDFATGRAVVPMDVDLQDPPELIGDMLALWREGFEMVLAQRSERSVDGWRKRTTAGLFYRIANRVSDVDLPADVGDFRLMDRKVVDALALMPERTRFMKGLFAWLGFRQATVQYARGARIAGRTKFRLGSLWRLALEGLVSFTTTPLKIWTYIGATFAILAFAYLSFIVGRTVLFGIDVPGYASLIAFTLFFSGLNLLGLGIIGEYLARVFIEVKRRPLYIVRETAGFDAAAGPRPSRARRL